MEVSYFVYIVRCKDGTLYTGSTNNIEKRLAAHNKGEGAKYTRGRQPVTLLYLEKLPSWSLSLRREHLIKGLSREKKLNLINSSSLAQGTGVSPSNFANQLIADS
ncbi:MAG: GIY-YIG nuclease family protein [Carboxydocellales bacterium]